MSLLTYHRLVVVVLLLSCSGLVLGQSAPTPRQPGRVPGRNDVLNGNGQPYGRSRTTPGTDNLGGQSAPAGGRVQGGQDVLQGNPQPYDRSRTTPGYDNLGGQSVPPAANRFRSPLNDSVGGSEQAPPLRRYPNLQPQSRSNGLPGAPSLSSGSSPSPISQQATPYNPPAEYRSGANVSAPGSRTRFGYDETLGKQRPQGVSMQLGIDPRTLRQAEAPPSLLNRLRGS